MSTAKQRNCDCSCGKVVDEKMAIRVERNGATYLFVDEGHQSTWKAQNDRLNFAVSGQNTAHRREQRLLRLFGGE